MHIHAFVTKNAYNSVIIYCASICKFIDIFCGNVNNSSMYFHMPGVLNIAVSTCSWKHGINTLQVSSKLEIFIYQRDSFGNIVPDIHPFDAQVVDKATNLSIPIVDLAMEAVADGVQLLSFNVVEAGQFFLTVFYAQLDERVSNSVHMFDVFVGMQLYSLVCSSRCSIPDHG